YITHLKKLIFTRVKFGANLTPLQSLGVIVVKILDDVAGDRMFDQVDNFARKTFQNMRPLIGLFTIFTRHNGQFFVAANVRDLTGYFGSRIFFYRFLFAISQ
uniref:Uncharacterized protein n=1 Tax=Romanomermis culicivorax TaxID=13658 RepID=A0A915HY44_ROMCU